MGGLDILVNNAGISQQALSLLLLMALGAYWLFPHTGEMSTYVAIYFSVIALMAAAASLSRIVKVWA